jgi:glycine/D-amino acid oxidase-like deaminating enzyme
MQRPVWFEEGYKPREPLEESIETEVVIIGGGITGTSAGYHLEKKGVDFALVEMGNMASGSTGSSTGGLVPGTELDLWQAIDKFGTSKALLLWEETRKFIGYIEGMVKKEHIDCDFNRVESFYLAVEKKHLKFIERECRLSKRYGFNVDMLDRKEMRDQVGVSDSFYGGMVYRDNAEVNPVRYARSLAGKIRKGTIYENTPVMKIRRSQGGFIVETKNGRISCKKLILATEAYTNDLKLFRAPMIRIRDRVIATERLSRKAMDEIRFSKKQLWGSDVLYNFLRTTADNRVCITGKDVGAGGKLGPISQKDIEELRGELAGYFPSLKDVRVERVWDGYLGLPVRLLPLIGRDPKYDSLFYSIGYGGHGMVFGTLGGKMVADICCGDQPDNRRLGRLLAPVRKRFPEDTLEADAEKLYIKLHDAL